MDILETRGSNISATLITSKSLQDKPTFTGSFMWVGLAMYYVNNVLCVRFYVFYNKLAYLELILETI